jgi:predicted protein tyrosine phosphatase
MLSATTVIELRQPAVGRGIPVNM